MTEALLPFGTSPKGNVRFCALNWLKPPEVSANVGTLLVRSLFVLALCPSAEWSTLTHVWFLGLIQKICKIAVSNALRILYGV